MSLGEAGGQILHAGQGAVGKHLEELVLSVCLSAPLLQEEAAPLPAMARPSPTLGCFWLQYCSAHLVPSVLPDPGCVLSAVGQKTAPCQLLKL